jgi:hypothetical protein
MRFPVVEVEYRLCACRAWEKLVAEPWRAKFRNTIAEVVTLDARLSCSPSTPKQNHLFIYSYTCLPVDCIIHIAL